MESICRTIAAWVFMGFYWSLFFLIFFASLRRVPDSFITGAIRLWGKVTLWILSIRVEVCNPSTLTERKARVIISNHQSALDLLWGALVCPPALLVIGKREVIYIPFLNVIWWALKFIRIDRKNSVRAISSLQKLGKVVTEEARSLVIAPEGTRTLDGSILPFKKGAFHIAMQSQLPIYPIVISGAFELLPKGAYFSKPGLIRLYFPPPVETRGLSIDQINSLIEKTRAQMIEVYEKLRKMQPM